MELLEPYLAADDYNLETAKKASGDVAGLLSWTKAMSYFYGINKEVLPLKANLVIQEARLEAAQEELSKAQAELDEKQRELDAVQARFDEAMREKQVLVIITCMAAFRDFNCFIESLAVLIFFVVVVFCK